MVKKGTAYRPVSTIWKIQVCFFSWLWWLDTVLFNWPKGISRYHSILLCICKPRSTNLIHQRFYHTPTTMFALCLPFWGRFLHSTFVPTCTPLLKGYTVYGIRHTGYTAYRYTLSAKSNPETNVSSCLFVKQPIFVLPLCGDFQA